MADGLGDVALAAEITARFDYANSWRKQNYDERAKVWYQLYAGFRPENDEAHRNRSNLHIPRSYEEIDTIRARVIKALFASRPYIDFLPSPRCFDFGVDLAVWLQTQEQKCQLAAALTDSQLHDSMPEFYSFVTSFLIFPSAVASVGWRYRKRKVRQKSQAPVFQRVWQWVQGLPFLGQVLAGWQWVEREVEVVENDENDFRCVDWFDFWPDPMATNLDNARFVFHREYLTAAEVDQRLDWLKTVGTGKVYKPDESGWRTLVGTASEFMDDRTGKQSAIGVATETDQGFWDDMVHGYMNEVLHYWEDDRHVIIINRTTVVYDGPNPYHRHGKKPFVVAVFDPLPGEFYGLSAMQLLEHLQEELNTQRNQRIDAVSLILNRIWKVRKGAGVDDSELISQPGGIIHEPAPGTVEMLDMKEVPKSVFTEETILKGDMENVVGVPPVVRGVASMRNETATEIVTKNTSAGYRFEVKAMLYEALSLHRLAYLFDCNNQQFVDRRRLVQVYGQAGMEWAAVGPEELIGEHDYVPASSSVDPMANKEIRRQQLLEMYSALKDNPFVDTYQLTRHIIQSYDVRNPQKFLRDRQQVEAQLAAQAQIDTAGKIAKALPAGGMAGKAGSPQAQMADLSGGGPVA